MSLDRINFEAKVAFLERAVDRLSEALHEQAETIEALDKRVAKLERRAASQGSDPDVGPQDSPPPHY